VALEDSLQAILRGAGLRFVMGSSFSYNDAEFGVLTATRGAPDAQANLPGCAASEDYAHDLGDTLEERLRVAIAYRQSNNTLCTGTGPLLQADGPAIAGGLALKAPEEPWRHNRIMGR